MHESVSVVIVLHTALSSLLLSDYGSLKRDYVDLNKGGQISIDLWAAAGRRSETNGKEDTVQRIGHLLKQLQTDKRKNNHYFLEKANG